MASYIFMFYPPPSSHRWLCICNFLILWAIFFSLSTLKSFTALNYTVFWTMYKTKAVSHNDLTFTDHMECTFPLLDSTWIWNLRIVETAGSRRLQCTHDLWVREITWSNVNKGFLVQLLLPNLAAKAQDKVMAITELS